jgi:copper resistance protein B
MRETRVTPAFLLMTVAAAGANGEEHPSDMGMEGHDSFYKVMIDQLEWSNPGAGEERAAWDAQAWYGGDYNKLRIKSEGRVVGGGAKRGVRDADIELLFDGVIARWWNLQAGARQDVGADPARTWLAVGVAGLAPQWIETEATAYLSDEGRAALRLKAQYELLVTQRLVLQPFAEANLYSHSDPRRELGSGLSELELSARLRYELRREIAPYVGVAWLRRFGPTAHLITAAGGDRSDLELVLGLHAWL